MSDEPRFRKPARGKIALPAWNQRLIDTLRSSVSGDRRATGGPNISMPTKTTRYALALVAAGAIVAAVLSFMLAGNDHHSLSAHAPGAPPTGAVAGAAFGTAQPGDCLTWNKPDASDLSKVDCGQKHLFEVAADIDLSAYPGAEFGAGTKFPGVLRFAELKDQHCQPAVRRYMSGHFDPHGKFAVGLINPGQAGWAAGERTLRCGIQDSTSTGTLQPFTGSVIGQDQSRVLDSGLCVGINQNLPTDPVDCATPHAFEVVSTVDLTPHFSDPPPADDAQDKAMSAICAKDSNAYLGGSDVLRNKTLTLFWDHIPPDSWLGGNRKLNCMIGKGGDQDGFAPITGSAKGDITINGRPPVAPPPLPSGRPMSR